MIEEFSTSNKLSNCRFYFGEGGRILKKFVSWIMFMLLFIAIFSLAINVKPVKSTWTGTVYIRADGSIDPPDAPIRREGETYILTDNIYNGGIIIEKSYIVVDGKGFSVQGTGALWTTGIELRYYVSNVIMKNLTIERFTVGVHFLDWTLSNIVIGNSIRNNRIGIMLWSSSNNLIMENSIQNNDYGIVLVRSSGNTIYHNNIIGNNRQVTFEYGSYFNVWDDDYPSGGNYWSDYAGVDANGDGIGDTPYIIDANNIDRYPLMNPWGAGTPIASFNWSPFIPEVGELVTFDASTSLPIGGEIVSYKWDFGDGNHASGKIVTHQYSSAGNYTVTLNVTDNEGLWDIEQKQIEIKAPLTVSISPLLTSITEGQFVTFTSTTAGGYPPYTYQWYLNNAPVLNATSEIWIFTPTEAGIYYVYLKVTDSRNNTVQSNVARITVTPITVGGHIFPVKPAQAQTSAKPLAPYMTLMVILIVSITSKRKINKIIRR